MTNKNTEKVKKEFEEEFLDSLSYMTGESEEDVKEYRKYEAAVNGVWNFIQQKINEAEERMIKVIEKAEPVRRGDWVIHYDWISKEDLLDKLKNTK